MSDENYQLSEGLSHLQSFNESMAQIPEEEMVIIKVHILMDQALSELIAASAWRSEFVPEMNFPEKIRMARALSYFGADSGGWKLLEKLNTLRNAVAHFRTQHKKHQLYLDMERLFLQELSVPADFLNHSKSAKVQKIGVYLLGTLKAQTVMAEFVRNSIKIDQEAKKKLAEDLVNLKV